MCKSKWSLFQDTLYYSVRVTYSSRVSRRRRDVGVVLFRITAPRNEIIKNLGTRAWNFQMTMQTANSHIFQENVGNYWFIRFIKMDESAQIKSFARLLNLLSPARLLRASSVYKNLDFNQILPQSVFRAKKSCSFRKSSRQ